MKKVKTQFSKNSLAIKVFLVLLIILIFQNSYAQVTLVKDINPGFFSSNINGQYNRLVKMGDFVYFGAIANNKSGLFKTDGTTAGTVRVTDANLNITVKEPTKAGTFIGWSGPNLAGSGEYPWASNGVSATAVGVNTYVQTLYPFNGEIFYAGFTFSEGFELWKFNSAGSAEMVKNLPGTGTNNSISPSKFVAHSDGYLYFLGWANNFTCALWKTDGTTAGTTKVKDMPYCTQLLSAGGKLFIFGPNDPPNYNDNHKLWVSDGTSAGTTVIKNFNPSAFPTSANYYTFNNRLFFSLDDQINGNELWMSDGTSVGTQMVENLNPGAASSDATPLGHVGDVMYLSANNGSTGPALYKLAPTLIIISGIQQYQITLVKDINTVSDATSYIDKGIEFQGKFYFSANDGNLGSELWRTDGTAAGTMLVGDISPTGGSFPSRYCVLNNKLLFEAYTVALDHELYKYEDPEFLPCENDLTLTGISTGILYEANSTIITSQTIPSLPDFTIFKAKAITLNPGFKTESGAKFMTISAGCN
jgi:ELWxxDGT repeat protein